MGFKGSGEPDATTRLVERQMLLSRVLAPAAPKPREGDRLGLRFVTISREAGSLGPDVALALGHRLGWTVYDREIVDSIARDSHARRILVEQLDEKSQSLVEDAVHRLLHMVEGSALSGEEYHEALVQTLASLGGRGEAILVGRGANFVLRGHSGLHARIVASQTTRIRRLAGRWQVTPEEAKRRMRKIDGERRRFILHHFGEEVRDPTSYDIVLNTDRLSVDQAAEALASIVDFPANRREHVRP